MKKLLDWYRKSGPWNDDATHAEMLAHGALTGAIIGVMIAVFVIVTAA